MELTGDLIITARAYAQDAQMAMQGDVVRGLVELITNSDDAYRGKSGSITISVSDAPEPFKAIISVFDKAGGLSGEGMQKNFIKVGGVNEAGPDGEGFGARGLFGRGAKDVPALGGAKFISIHNGKYTDLEINPQTAKYNISRFEEVATSEDYAASKLSEGESGLTAQIFIAKAISMPSTNELINKLQTNVQLRDLLNRNNVKFIDSNGKETILHGMELIGEKILDVELDLSPSYSEKAHLVLHKLPTKVMSTVNEYSQHGLVISGRGAVYENSFLNLTGKAEAGWFCGTLEAPEIYDLSRSFDSAGATELNPTRLISRTRDGLVRTHPYYRALAAAVEKHLRPIFEEQAKSEGATKREGESLKRKIQSISQVLGSTLQQILNEDNAGELPKLADWDGESVQMTIIPPKRIMHVGDEVTLSVRIPNDIEPNSVSFDIIGDDGVILLSDEAESHAWTSHERLPCKTTSIKIKAQNLGEGFVRAKVENKAAMSEINVVLFDRDTETVCKALEFAPSKYSSMPGKSRNLLLRAPIDLTGESVTLTYSGNEVVAPAEVVLKPADSGKAAVAVVRVAVGDEIGLSVATAKLNKQTAEAQIDIKEPTSGMIPKIDIVFAGNENPPRRVDTIPEDGKLVVKIYARHNSLKQIFGKHTGSGFEHEEDESALATTAEIVAAQLASYAVEQDAARNPIRYQDASSYFVRQQELVGRMVVAAQAGLLS